MGYPNNDVMDNMAASLTAGIENHLFFGLGGQFPSKFNVVITKIPLFDGMMVWILK